MRTHYRPAAVETNIMQETWHLQSITIVHCRGSMHHRFPSTTLTLIQASNKIKRTCPFLFFEYALLLNCCHFDFCSSLSCSNSFILATFFWAFFFLYSLCSAICSFLERQTRKRQSQTYYNKYEIKTVSPMYRIT